MAHAPVDHVGDGLEAAVRMRRKTGDVVLGAVGAELVEHQERVGVTRQLRIEQTRQLHAGAIFGGTAGEPVGDFADAGDGCVHGSSLLPANLRPK